MLVVMAVNAEQFPIAAVEGVIVVIMINVVHGEFTELFALEFPGASAANRREQFQCLFPVSRLAFLLLTAHFGDQAVTLFGILVIC
jgi:hypothetical protein